MSLVEVRDAVVEFSTQRGAVRALDGVSLDLGEKETLAIVGESGCGKTTLARAILGLQPLAEGSIRVCGREVTGLRAGQAEEVGMVWQDPYASLDPRWTLGRTISEPARTKRVALDVDGLLNQVGLDPSFASRYPHQLSGGQRQRAAIARALALWPPLVICDEPTAALDLSVQAQILNLLRNLKQSGSASFLYISHDLGTVRFLADRIIVMYLGRVVEVGTPEDTFERPLHPYTRMLVDSTPSLTKLGKLPPPAIGEPPDPVTRWQGCRYEGRCQSAVGVCATTEPPWYREGDHVAACHVPNLRNGTENLG
ncbi:MAG: ABC transporter ATP-binding protein [Fimbriimonadaceae bacterium]|nr:ABC transporter ATP-binding protein [Fimbriimonadaceae bacterium]